MRSIAASRVGARAEDQIDLHGAVHREFHPSGEVPHRGPVRRRRLRPAGRAFPVRRGDACRGPRPMKRAPIRLVTAWLRVVAGRQHHEECPRRLLLDRSRTAGHQDGAMVRYEFGVHEESAERPV